MKIIFAGTPLFAAEHLAALINSQHEIVAVFTQPDRPAGRGQKLLASPVKLLAQKNNLPIYSPLKLDISAQELLTTFKAEVMVVVAYGLILPKAVLSIPQYGCINVHASLLPRWRGAAPIQRAILAGDAKTGVTIMQMDVGLDTGDMLYQVDCPILSTETTESLHNKLIVLGQKALLSTLDQLPTISPEKQDDTKTCYAAKIQKSESIINWNKSAVEIGQQIRAFDPWPIAQTLLGGTMIRIWSAVPLAEKSNDPPGFLLNLNKNFIDVATGDGVLRLLKIQFPGGKAMSVEEVLKSKLSEFQQMKYLGG